MPAKGKKKPAKAAPAKLSRAGAQVRYCGHDASFIADVYEVGNAVVIVANGPLWDTAGHLKRPAGKCTHHVVDFPQCGY